MIRLESHCHSVYSFDSQLKIESIAEQCAKQKLDAIILCDHDVCGIMDRDEAIFSANQIKVFKAIEFTTMENAHIIGVSDAIKEIQRKRYYYSLRNLIKALVRIDAAIIVPHPSHETGILGNHNVNKDDAEFVLSKADFVECANYRYGDTSEVQDICMKYKHLKMLVGSDAHSAKDVGAFYNEINCEMNQKMRFKDIKKYECRNVYRLQHSKLYWMWKRIKKTSVYQFLMNLVPSNTRRKIKNILFN